MYCFSTWPSRSCTTSKLYSWVRARSRACRMRVGPGPMCAEHLACVLLLHVPPAVLARHDVVSHPFGHSRTSISLSIGDGCHFLHCAHPPADVKVLFGSVSQDQSLRVYRELALFVRHPRPPDLASPGAGGSRVGRGGYPPRPSRTRTCGFPASGSSSGRFAPEYPRQRRRSGPSGPQTREEAAGPA